MKKNDFIIIFLSIAISICGVFLENSKFFETTVRTLKNRQLPSSLLNYGKTGQLFKRMGLPYIAPKEEDTDYPIPKQTILNLTKLDIRKEWIGAENLPPEKIISTTIMDQSIIKTGMPIISLYMDYYDLYDKFNGIYTNPLERGRNWERPCFISYFKNGKLIFGTHAGARIHGGTSRLHDLKSFRLYFRPTYGKEEFLKGVLFNGSGDPLKTIIVRKADEIYGFVNSMAYEIARKAGCYAPFTEPAKLYLNGKPHGHGNFEIIEHITKQYCINHFGHDNFVFYKVKGGEKIPPEYKVLSDWARFSKDQITFESVSQLIDMENFIKTWIVNIICGNSDPYQGVALLDKTQSNPKWFWIMWDMDHSFKNIYEHDKKNIWEKERPINLVYSDKKKETDPRYFIFRKLILHDDHFRKLFKKQMEDKYNYVLTTDYLLSVVDKYIAMAKKFGMDVTKAEKELHEYMIHRPEFSMNMMNRYFNLGDVKKVRFTIPSGVTVTVNGYPIKKSFTGLYFQGSEIILSVSKGTTKGWMINGTIFNNSNIKIKIQDNINLIALQ
ncbi:MAG: CotH kinase family protein [Spirochaetota bacterium]